MLFQWVTKGQYDFVTHDSFHKLGSKLVGISHKMKKPYEVVLNREELKYLIQNPKYAMEVLIQLSPTKQEELSL